MTGQYRDPLEMDQQGPCRNSQNPPRSKRLTIAATQLRFGPVERLLVCLALACTGCGEQEIRAIERLPPPTPVDSTTPPDETPPEGGAGGANGAGGAGGDGQSPPDPPTVHDRGRVQVRDGNLLSDKGTRLRGVTFGLDANGAAFKFEPSFVAALSHQAGLNTLHVYAENSSQPSGSHAEEVDRLVEMTSAAGMYLVIGIGGGATGGSFNIDKVRSFWSFYGPRYASRTHVLYEVQNVPDPGCSESYKPETLAMEKEIYMLIRGFAPSTHVALFSFIAQPSGPVLKAALDALEGSVDWSKASVAFHTQPCAGQNNLTALLEVARPRGIAVLGSEMAFTTSYETTAQLEAERVGWFNFEWLVLNRDLTAFRDGHGAAGISWCPDFGAWPEDSETCSTP